MYLTNKILNNDTSLIEFMVSCIWIVISVAILTLTPTTDMLWHVLNETFHPVVWATGFFCLSFVHFFALSVSDCVGVLPRLMCSVVGFVIMSYICILGALTEVQILLTFPLVIGMGLGYTLIRHGVSGDL